MKKVGILFVLYFNTLIIVGQLPVCNESISASGPEIPGKIFYESEKNSENNPFLYDDWRQGSIVLINGYLAENVSLKYNANTDDLVYHNERLNYAVIVEKEYVQEFTLTNPAISKKNHFRRLGIKNIYFPDSTGCFAEKLEKGKYSLYCVRVKQKTKSSQTSQTTVQKHYYKSLNLYYLQLPNGKITHFLPRNRELKRMISPHRDELRSFMRRERIKSRKEEDLIRAIHYCNTIGQQ